jgi:hypothetical protein
VVRFRASSEEAVSEVADLGVELGDLLLKSVFALSSALMQGLVVMGLLSEGDSFEAVRAGLVRGVASKQGWGEFAAQARRGRVLLAGSGGITDEANRAHASSMTTAQLQSQVSRKGSPIVYTGFGASPMCKLS